MLDSQNIVAALNSNQTTEPNFFATKNSLDVDTFANTQSLTTFPGEGIGKTNQGRALRIEPVSERFQATSSKTKLKSRIPKYRPSMNAQLNELFSILNGGDYNVDWAPHSLIATKDDSGGTMHKVRCDAFASGL